MAATLPALENHDQGGEADSKPQPDSSDLEIQVKARDSMIEDLNKRIIQLSSQAKRLDTDSAAAKERQLKQLLEDKASLLKQLKAAETTIGELQEKMQKIEAKQEEDKQTHDALTEAQTEELEQLKSRLSEKTSQNTTAKSDVTQMSQIVQEMTSLNTELNEKILKMNQDMEENNKTVFEATAKSSQTEELEKELVEEKTKNQQMEVELRHCREDGERWEEKMKHITDIVGRVCEELNSSGLEECKKAVETLKNVQTYSPSPKLANSESTLTFQLQQLKSDLKSERKESARISKIDSLQRARISALESEKTKIKGELGFVVEKQRKQIGVLKDWMKSAVEKSHETEDRLEEVTAELQQSQTAVLSLNEKVTHFKAQLTDLKKSEEGLKQSVKSLKFSLIDAQSDRTAFESSLLSRESIAKDATSRIEALTEELWKRDNDLLRKETQRLKQQEEMNNMKASLQSSHVQFKIRMSEEIAKANLRLESKEMENNELKRMLAQGAAGSKKPASKGNQATCARLEDAFKQVKILKDRSKSTTGDDSDRQLVETLKQRCITVLSTVEKDLQAVLSTSLTVEEANSFPGVKEILTGRGVGSLRVEEVLGEMKSFVSAA